MENLSTEKLINKNEKIKINLEKENKDEKTDDKNDTKNNKDKSFPENKNENELSTNFEENIELTEEEKKLRQNYLKKVTKKEALIRSIILGKKQYYIKLYSFITNLIHNMISLKESIYKSDAVNAITGGDLNKFIISVEYHIIATFMSKMLILLDEKIFKILNKDLENNNIMLENLLFKKDIVFFDLFKTGELNNKVSTYANYPYFNIIDTISRIVEYIFKIIYFGYYLIKDFFEMSIIYIIVIIMQMTIEPFIFINNNNDEIIEKVELKQNYINDIISNIRLIKSFGTEKKELNRVKNIDESMKNKGFFKQLLLTFFANIFIIKDIMIFYICGKKSIQGKMNYGGLLIFQEYSSQLNICFTNLRQTIKSIKEGINSWIKFLQIYEIEQKIISRKNIIPEENSEKK